MNRKEKRKAAKKLKRKMLRRQTALKEREEQEAQMNSPEELSRLIFMEEEETQRMELERKKFEEKDRLWLEAMEIKRKAVEHRQNEMKLLAELSDKPQNGNEVSNNESCENFEDGTAEIIWDGNEIIVKKKKDKRTEQEGNKKFSAVDIAKQTSNPFPPQSEDFPDFKTLLSSEHIFEDVTQQIPNFGTEQDKAHCPFHFKTGACRFGHRCNRLHMYPDKSCTLLMKNMYHGPGILCEQDEGLEYTDEEINHCFEEFYEDAHTEFLKFGEIVNFKVCKNNSFHLRGNVYVHYKSMDSAIAAHHTINGRYFAGKQVNCEYVCVTKWKTAICGEYMKSRSQTCSRGTACNFIHCFRNPGGDYEWADLDRSPPRYWSNRMLSLFGSSASPPEADEYRRARRRKREDQSRAVTLLVEKDVVEKRRSRRGNRDEKDKGDYDYGDHHGRRRIRRKGTHRHMKMCKSSRDASSTSSRH